MFRNTKQMGRWTAIAVTVALLCFSVAQAKNPPKPPGGGGGGGASYTIVKLDDEDQNGTWECYARDINNLGEVVGQVDDPETPEVRAAYWEVSGSGGSIQSQLSTLTGGKRAHGINDVGEIVGYGENSSGQNVGVYWVNAGAAPLALPPLSGDTSSCAYAINNDGVVCGYSSGEAVAWRVNWDGGEPIVWGPLPLPALDDSSYAYAINNNDQDGCAEIVGYFGTGSNPTAAVVWTVQSLPGGTLAVVDTRIVEEGLAKALGVNDSGTICGEVGWPTEAVVWSESASQTLNLAKQLVDASAQAVNNSGTIVGCASTGMINDRAVVWANADAKMVELNKYVGRKSPFLSLVRASAVNDSGEIVGYGFTEVGGWGDAGFLAIPE